MQAHTLLLGFETDIYAPPDYCMVFWSGPAQQYGNGSSLHLMLCARFCNFQFSLIKTLCSCPSDHVWWRRKHLLPIMCVFVTSVLCKESLSDCVRSRGHKLAMWCSHSKETMLQICKTALCRCEHGYCCIGRMRFDVFCQGCLSLEHGHSAVVGATAGIVTTCLGSST